MCVVAVEVLKLMQVVCRYYMNGLHRHTIHTNTYISSLYLMCIYVVSFSYLLPVWGAQLQSLLLSVQASHSAPPLGLQEKTQTRVYWPGNTQSASAHCPVACKRCICTRHAHTCATTLAYKAGNCLYIQIFWVVSNIFNTNDLWWATTAILYSCLILYLK